MNSNNNNITAITTQQTMTSMQIAEITGKPHNDVLKAIRVMEPAWEAERGGKFSLSFRTVKGQGAKQYPYYILNKTECLYVATKFNDQARARLVLRWEQLEQERQASQPVPSVATQSQPQHPVADPANLTRKQLLLMALEAEEENERLRAERQELEAEHYAAMIESAEKDTRIKALERQVTYLDLIDRSRDTLNTTQVAQDYGYTAVSFNQLLKGLRIQYNSGGQWILYAPYINRGYVANRQVEITHSNGHRQYKQITVWTTAGRHFLYEQLKRHGILPLVERIQQPALPAQ